MVKPPRLPSQIFSQLEWPTLGLSTAIYGGWLALTYWHRDVPLPVKIVCGGWLVAWQCSLQHETIHGHPTPWRRVNTFIAIWPLSLWLPYELYRKSHLAHHATEHLTLPRHDPETHYRAAPTGVLKRMDHALASAASTLLGRLALGPPLVIGRFLAAEGMQLMRSPERAAVWLRHVALAGVVVFWLQRVCHMRLGEYVLAYLYPGAALTLLRGFAEHRHHRLRRRRAAVVERAPVLGLLFLHNNLHALHHERPRLAWYRLPSAYRDARRRLLEANGGLVYNGYREVFARFLLAPHDRIIHPDFDVEAGA